ncbi:hypothetical protein ANRL4_01041 [Anaerolineae bacterium]|nr:hypothetical protein ANRL4_01041 [Anaerolineae bacterium]
MHILNLQSVDSRYATPAELSNAGITSDQIPPDWQLMAHQAATIGALRRGDTPIILNEAMTGDGKSLAGQYRLFVDGASTLTLYPTNELIRDQRRVLETMRAVWKTGTWARYAPLIEEINAAVMDDIQDADDLNPTRTDVIRRLLGSDLTLTNPDIFHLLMQFRYQQQGAAPDLIAQDVAHRFRLFVFDEFHLFGAPQVGSVLTAMAFLRAVIGESGDKARFLFLSATPQNLLTDFAVRLNMGIIRIQGDYQNGMSSTPDGYRRILQSSTLYLHTGRMEDWVNTHWEDIVVKFFQRHRPGAKGVIICNSVATAYRLQHLLKPLESETGIRIGLNTGLTPREERAKEGEFDLLIATSTVDVGVDFRINLLIFESMDTATHIQRLGRLGRHTTSSDGTPFEAFEAHALLPAWVVEGLSAKCPTQSEICRKDYQQALHELYPPLQQFPHYVPRWGGVQMAHVLRELRKPPIKATYTDIRTQLESEFPHIAKNYKAKYFDLTKSEQLAIRDEACSFRGNSPFVALVLDQTSKSRQIVSYDLMSLLLRADVDEKPVDEFYAIAERQGQSLRALKRGNPLVAYTLLGWVDSPRIVRIRIDIALREYPEMINQVIETDRISLDVRGVPGLAALNRKLEERTQVAYLLRGEEPIAIRRKLRLGFQVELFTFESTDNVTGCIAFARDALLLDSVVWRHSQPSDPFIY